LTSSQVITEAGRNLKAKLPSALPVFRLPAGRCLMVVADPPAHEPRQFEGRTDPKDPPILLAARREGCPWLVTFNTHHFEPGFEDFKVLPPGDFILRIRDHLANR